MSDEPMARILTVLERLEAGQDQLRTEQAQLRTELLSELGRNRAELRSELVQLRTEQQGEQAQLRAELLSELVQLRADLMARVDRVQNTLTSIRDDITVNMGRADHAHRAADNVRDELRALSDVVTGVIRQVQRLQSDVRELRGEP